MIRTIGLDLIHSNSKIVAFFSSRMIKENRWEKSNLFAQRDEIFASFCNDNCENRRSRKRKQ